MNIALSIFFILTTIFITTIFIDIFNNLNNKTKLIIKKNLEYYNSGKSLMCPYISDINLDKKFIILNNKNSKITRKNIILYKNRAIGIVNCYLQKDN